MRRWDRLLDTYIDEYQARGICQATVAATESRLHRWGLWLKKRRPRVAIEEIGAELISLLHGIVCQLPIEGDRLWHA